MRSATNPRSAACFALAAILFFVPSEGVSETPQIDALRIDTPPEIDGKLDEGIWDKATLVTDFRQREPDEGKPASERTEVRICFDEKHLYLAFRCFDSQPELIRRSVMQRDAQVRDSDDYVFVTLDPFRRERDGFTFLVNANGAKSEGKMSASRYQPDTNWDTIWDVAAQIDEEGWTAEMEIPFRGLNFDPQQLVWGINFGRFIPRKQEEIRWSGANRNREMFRLEDAGQLTGLQNLEPGIGIDLSPYVSSRWDKADGDFEFDTGVDAFYQITPGLTATLTLNTDFAETEVDQRRINLTRFPLFFPEKRDFFLEGAEFFDLSAGELFQPFHSRTIGLSSDGEKIDLLGGAKLTGRAGKLGVGVLGTRLDGLDGLDRDDAYVGRFTYDIFEESHIGLLTTYGDPRANADNNLIGVDINLRDSNFIGDNVLDTVLWGMTTDDAGKRAEAFGGQIRAINDPLAFLIEGEQVDDDFRPAMGFLRRTGRRGRGFIRYRFRPEAEWIQWTQLAINENIHTTMEGDIETNVFAPGQFSLKTKRGDQLFITPEIQREVLFDDFAIRPNVTIPTGDYRFQSWRFNISTTDAKPLSIGLGGNFGEFFDGERLQLNPGLVWRQSRYFQVDAGVSYNDIDLPGGSFETMVGFAGLRLTPNPRLSWNTLAQWDSVSDRIGINSRVRWIVKPGHDVFFVVNQGYDLIDNNLRSTQTETIAKVGMTFRF